MTTGHCESSLGSFDELQNSAQAAVDPQTKPPDLGCESACRQLSCGEGVCIYGVRGGPILRSGALMFPEFWPFWGPYLRSCGLIYRATKFGKEALWGWRVYRCQTCPPSQSPLAPQNFGTFHTWYDTQQINFVRRSN